MVEEWIPGSSLRAAPEWRHWGSAQKQNNLPDGAPDAASLSVPL